MRRLLCIVALVSAVATVGAAQQPQGTAERIGEQIDRGLSQLGTQLSEAWSDVRRGVEKMGVQGRVYGRLHWDKALQGAKIDIDIQDTSTVVLQGTVPTDRGKLKAEELARDTIGVTHVENQLVVAAADIRTEPNRTTDGGTYQAK